MAGSSRERFGDVPSVRTGLGRRERARSLSPRRKRPSRRRRTIAIDGERRATRPRRGDRNATKCIPDLFRRPGHGPRLDRAARNSRRQGVDGL
jgi:hypothetical protein